MATPRGSAPLRLHQRCELASYGQGEILFVGQTSFSAGLWAGIALDEPIGKHDGVVQGKRYFTASPGHGIFVRPSQLRVIDDDDDGDGGDENDEEDQHVQEQEASPDPNRLASRRTSATSSRTPSRLMSSPAKPAATSRPSSAMPPPVAPSASAALRAARTSSPSKASAALSRTSSNRSPTKTPARATPISRTGTTSGRASVVSRPSSTLGRPTTTSPQARTPGSRTPASAAAARTPGTATVPRTAARAAVQAAKAPDSATARAGLRPVVKSRLSMAPPTSARPTSPTRRAQTPSASTSARIGAGAGAGVSRLSDPLSSSSSTAKKPLLQRALTSASTSRRGSEQDFDQAEDLLAMDLDDAGLDQRLVPSSSDSSHLSDHVDLAMQQEEGLVSPSLRKSATVARPDYMSLSSGPSMTALSRNTGEVAAMQRELEELRVKVRIAEKKREEDRERVRDAERIQMDSEQFLAIKPKMQAKQQELQDQLKDLHKMEKDWTIQKEELERQMGEMTDQLEIATLDREVAEEKAEGALEELRLMTDKVEELQVDIEVLREENAMYEQGPVDDKDKLSVGYVQLEKQNERLKDALLRLRDITSETDAEQRKKIAQLEKDLNALDDLQVSYEGVCEKLETSDALLEDLKIQLDDALGAEEMLEQLTERNMVLGEKVQELTVAVEDLESLKELNDELEETHLETEKQLQEEIDLKEMQLREHGLRTETLEANIVDYESTFGQFRELVMNLQNELETARKDGNAMEAGRDGKEDQAMLNLNLKLQSSTIKSQAKTIELEIGKLQAQQAKVNLEMISPYLPKEFFENDKDACDSLLFFQRVAAKSDMIKTIVEGNHDIASNLVGVVYESLIKVCKMRRSLAHFVVSARQISAVIQLASIPTFLKAGRMYKELVSIERRIDHFIEQLREEALNEEECGKEYSRFVGLLEDFDYALVEQANDGLDSDLAAKEVGSAILLDLDLDTIAAALGFSKQNIASLYNDLLSQASGEESDEMRRLQMIEKDINEGLFTPIQDLINTMRATKVPARKLLRRLSSLSDNSEAVKMEAIVKLPGLGKLTSQLVEFSSMLVNNFSSYTNEARLNKTPLDVKALLAFVREAAAEALDQVSSDSPWSFTRSEATRLNQTVSELLGAATEQENVMKISGPFPWTGRVEEIKQMQSQNIEMQRIVTKQAEDLKDMYRQTKVRDELLQENNIKIERLARQLQKSKDELSAVASLKSDLSDTTKRMKAYEDGNSALQGELEQLQREYETAVKERGAPTEAGEGASARLDAAAGGGSAVAASEYSRTAAVSSSSLEVSYLVDQLEAVRGALRHCRLENSMLKSRDVLGQLDSLPPLTPIRSLDEGAEEEGDAASTLGLPKQHKRTKPSVSTTAEGRKLVRDLLAVASSPRVITLTSPSEGQRKDGAGRAWTPLAKQPLNQYLEQQKQRSHIQQQIISLQSRMNGLPSVVSLRA